MNEEPSEQKASPPRTSDTTVHTIHEVRCRDTGGRSVRLVVTDNIAVVKIALKGTEVVAEEMSIDFRDVLALNDTLLRGSQALTGLTPPAPAFEVVSIGEHAAYVKGRQDQIETSRGRVEVNYRHRHWWWPFGPKELWTRQIG